MYYYFNSANVQYRVKCLLKASGKTLKDLCQQTELTMEDLDDWMQEEKTLDPDDYMAIANFFGVPLDFLFGRDKYSGEEEVISEYKKIKNVLLNQPLSAEVTADLAEHYYNVNIKDLPYPYNMVVYIARSHVPLTEDQLNGIDAALDTLPEDERTAMLLRYKDHLSVAKIADHFGTTLGKAHTKLNRGFYALRSQPNCNLIKFGLKGSKQHQYEEELNQREEALNKRKEKLDVLDSILDVRTSKFDANKWAEIFYQTYGISIDQILNTYIQDLPDMYPSAIDRSLRDIDMYTIRDAINFDSQNNHSRDAWTNLKKIGPVLFKKLQNAVYTASGYKIGMDDSSSQSPMAFVLEQYAKKQADEEGLEHPEYDRTAPTLDAVNAPRLNAGAL